MLLKVLKIICVLCLSFDNTLKEGAFVRNVHSILAQNCFLEASGNFSTNVPFYVCELEPPVGGLIQGLGEQNRGNPTAPANISCWDLLP